MRYRTPARRGLLAAAIITAVLPGLTGPGPAPHVTLVTGDEVQVASTGAVSVRAAAGRSGVPFTSYRPADGHLYVVPADAAPMLGAGSLDLRLFDVTGLVESGYDTARGDL